MGSVENSIAAQAKIRRISEEQHNVLKGFDSWEKSIKRRDKELRHCYINSSDKSEFSSYTFDQAHTSVIDKKIKEDEIPPLAKIKGRNSSLYITPSTITATQLRAVSKVDVEPNVQSEISANSKQELANSARLRGNKFFADEKFDEAIKSYTKSIMLDSNSCIVYSNRAMAYLKIKDWKNAEEDSSYALKQDPLHAKSYQRRAMAMVAQGKLRAGLKDLNLADSCSERSSHKELLREKKKVQTLLLEAIRRAPKRDLNIIEISEPNSSFTVDSKISTDLNGKKTEDDSKNNLQRCHQSKARKMLSNLSSTPDNNIESTNKIEKQAWKAPKTWH